MATARALRLLPPVDEDLVEVSRRALDELVTNIDRFADDLDEGLEACASKIFAGSRPAALNELHRMGLRIQQAREVLEPFGAQPTEPRPIRLA